MIRSRAILILAVLLSLGTATAQKQDLPHAKVRLERDNPHETVRTFLSSLQPERDRIDLAIKTINFADVPQVAKQKQLARHLKAVLDGRGLIVEMDKVPRNEDYVDSISDGNIYVLFPDKEPRIYLAKTGKVWTFSRITVSYIPEMYGELYPWGLDRLVQLLPHDGPKVFGLELWQIIGLFLLIAIGTLIGWLLGNILLWIFGRFFLTWGAKGETGAIIHKAIRPVAFAIGFYLTKVLMPALLLPVEASRLIIFGLDGLMVICFISIVYRLSDLIWFRLRQRADDTESQLDDALVPLTERATKFVIILVGLIFLLQSWDFNVTALLAGVSIGGVALAFAAQNTIANLFGSAMIFFDRPFQIGDWIRVDGKDGTVEAIGFRSTRVRTFENSLMSIPNGRLADASVDNYGLRVYRRYRTMLGLEYDTPPEKVEEFVEGLRRVVMEHPHTVKDPDRLLIYFNEYAAFSLNILVYIFFETPTWRDELHARHELNVAFLKLAKEVGVSYAFPTQTLHVDSMPSMPGQPSPRADA